MEKRAEKILEEKSSAKNEKKEILENKEERNFDEEDSEEDFEQIPVLDSETSGGFESLPRFDLSKLILSEDRNPESQSLAPQIIEGLEESLKNVFDSSRNEEDENKDISYQVQRQSENYGDTSRQTPEMADPLKSSNFRNVSELESSGLSMNADLNRVATFSASHFFEQHRGQATSWKRGNNGEDDLTPKYEFQRNPDKDTGNPNQDQFDNVKKYKP